MRLQIKSLMSIKTTLLVALLMISFSLTGCLSHWVLESSSRLQVENGTQDYSIVGVDVLANDGTMTSWVDETILPGERSRVVEQDWVGEFQLRFKYTKSKDGTGEVLFDDRDFDLEGGSLYLTIGVEGDSLTYRFR